MIEKQLINLLLEKDFYEENKGRVSKSMFTNGTGKLNAQAGHSQTNCCCCNWCL